ncbi:MAG: hypothetical protein ABIQ70_02160 [Dokdonella sp.]
MARNHWHSSRNGLLAGVLLLGLSRAFAQDAVLDAQDQEQPPSRSWTTFGDLWIGYDHVSGLPGGRANLARVRGRARLGGIWNFASEWELGGALRVADGSDANRDNRRNNDNERSDSVGLDQLFVRWHASETTNITAGKTPLAFDLSPMVWDQDLRPAGVTFDHSIAFGEFNRLQLGAAALAGQNLYGDESRIGALQAAWRWHEGAPLSGSMLLTYLDFSDIEELAHQGMSRTNSVVAGRYVNDYRLLDLQLVGRYKLARWPIEVRFDRVHNLGADVARDGTRGSLTVGDRLQPQGWEFGYANQRIERDAVLAAFNSDEWWFHSATRGQLAWVGYGLDATWNLRLSGFRERRDGLHRDTDRLRVDLSARW